MGSNFQIESKYLYLFNILFKIDFYVVYFECATGGTNLDCVF